MLLILKNGKRGDEYLTAVKEKLIGAKVIVGYQIKNVIGVGNIGTTVLAYDS